MRRPGDDKKSGMSGFDARVGYTRTVRADRAPLGGKKMRITMSVVLALAILNVQAADPSATNAAVEAAPGVVAAPPAATNSTSIWNRYTQIVRGGTGCGDGVCGGSSQGEDCNSCASDCATGGSAACGDGLCSAADGENCVNCPSDCNGEQKGKPANRFCCGSGDGQNPVPCSDPRCTTAGFSCSDIPFQPWCCGDGVCDFGESCAADGLQAELCSGGGDEDCDAAIDCADSDCANDPACVCHVQGAACSNDKECCSGRCRGRTGAQTCR